MSIVQKEAIEASIQVLSGLLGYSERLGLVSDIPADMYCKENGSTCYARENRLSYEHALRTAIDIMTDYLNNR